MARMGVVVMLVIAAAGYVRVTIPILNDTLLENNETFFVTLSNPVNGVIIGTNPMVVTIEDNEELAQISFAATTLSLPETAGQVQVIIQQNQAHTVTGWAVWRLTISYR